ncbi:MerR family transcriptional regulator [Kitasatospora sp. NPDC050543]|uniref:helix-turn-helix domain-containing protein n=1 Tax=Kitasatospora sp. NPDC050543 TaxID=3364054 RepID=UPI0037BB5BBF
MAGAVQGLSIGELAEAAGVSVKTVRFYSDSGVLPESGRSAGGHRRYGEEALERLRTVRRLRALGLGLPAVEGVLRGGAGLDEALARQRAEVGRRLTELRWNEAALEALALAGPEGLELLGDALRTTPTTDALAAFWRRVLPARLPARLVSAIVDAAVPELPSAPTAQQALAYARLHALATDRAAAAAVREASAGDYDAVLYYEGLGEAYELAGLELAGREPGDGLAPGAALDCFVAAHAAAKGKVDSADFRRSLTLQLRNRVDPLMLAYWSLSAQLRPAEAGPDMGTAHAWLLTALKQRYPAA